MSSTPRERAVVRESARAFQFPHGTVYVLDEQRADDAPGRVGYVERHTGDSVAVDRVGVTAETFDALEQSAIHSYDVDRHQTAAWVRDAATEADRPDDLHD